MSVAVAGAPPGVMGVWSNAQVGGDAFCTGVIAHERFTLEAKPFTLVTVIVDVDGAPATTDVGDRAELLIVKSGGTSRPYATSWFEKLAT